jgi:hypothetical protein
MGVRRQGPDPDQCSADSDAFLLLAVFAGVGLILALTGIYSVIVAVGCS